jgi:CBS domain-containing protein
MKAREIMTAGPACCTPEDTAQDAARKMVENDCGCLPVVDNMDSKHITGVVTDRDLAARGLAEGKGADTSVREVMSADPSCCTPDADVEEVERIMAERQVRRVPVIDEEDRVVGIIAQADLARSRAASDDETGRVVERISEPTDRPRSESDVGTQSRGMS